MGEGRLWLQIPGGKYCFLSTYSHDWTVGFGVSQESVDHLLSTAGSSVQVKTITTPKKTNSNFAAASKMYVVCTQINPSF